MNAILAPDRDHAGSTASPSKIFAGTPPLASTTHKLLIV